MIETERKYNIESLQNERVKHLYQQRLNNKLTQSLEIQSKCVNT